MNRLTSPIAPCSALVLSLAVASSGFVAGCDSLPGSNRQQGTVIGGVGGAAAGAAVGGEDHRLLGALIGGVLGAGGGYLIGAQTEKIDDDDTAGAAEAVRQAQTDPATADDVYGTTTADLNNDGFVTLDEVVAMERAGLTDGEMISRLEATDQVFELTDEQRTYLLDRGVSSRVVSMMPELNQDIRSRYAAERTDVIGRPQN